MNLGRWRLWTLTGIAAAIGLFIAAGNDDDAVVAPVDRPAAAVAAAARGEQSRRPQSAQPSRVELERLARSSAPRDAGNALDNAFAAATWQVVQAPEPTAASAAAAAAAALALSAKAEPPPPPRAPVLPFTYLGRFEDAATRVVMLVKGDRVHTVAHGDVIEGTYRVDRIDDQQVELTYLPLDQKQSLATGGTS